MNSPTRDSETPPERQQPKTSHRQIGTAIILLSTLFVAWFVVQSQPLQSANDRSRWSTVWSLVERGTYQIDEIDQVPEWSTIDKVRHRASDTEPWHFYSSKPPLLSTVVAGLYWVERNTLGYNLRDDGPTASRLLLIAINVIPWCLALFSFRGSLQVMGVTGPAQWFILLAAGFGSMLNPFLTTLNNHTPAAISLIFCLSAMIRLSIGQSQRTKDFAIVGFTAAVVVCFELPAALFGVASFLFVAWINWKKAFRAYVPAAIIPLAAFFLTNWICTGGIKPFYAYYGTEKYVYVHEGIPSYWSNPQGIDANTESTLVYLFHCVLGHHGLLSLTPVFLLTLAGWLKMWKADGRVRHATFLLAMGAALSAAILTFYLSRTQNYNYGGNSAALRWMLWLTPFWWYGMIRPVVALSRTKGGITVLYLLLSLSVYSSVYSIRQPWQPGWVYQRMLRAGLIDYRTKMAAFDPPRYSVLGSIGEPEVGEWVSRTTTGARTLRIESLPLEQRGNQAVIPLKIGLTDGDVQKSATVVILVDEFRRGNDIAVWLQPQQRFTSSEAPSEPVPRWVVDLLRGLPSSRAYNAETPRHLKYTRSTGEKWALQCERGAARVKTVDAQNGDGWQRCDVYYSSEVPFGVAAWFISVSDAQTSQVIRTESWIARQLPE